jgi:hypothetical protein
MTPQRFIDSTEALYRKLERTFDRRPAYGEHQVDWVFDFAVTAWHLVDWIAIETGARLADTQQRLKTKCPELAVCEQLCNGAKHLELRNRSLKSFDFAADVRATDDRAGIVRNVLADDSPVDIVLTPVVSIVDKDHNSWQALDLFHKVLRFWQAELGLPD